MRRIIEDLPLRTYVSLPDGEVKNIAIFFHGYGADGKDLFSLSEPLRISLPDTAFYFPDAPTPMGGVDGIGFFGGFEWFSLSDYNPAALTSIEEAEKYCRKMIPLAEKTRAITEQYVNEVMARHNLTEKETVVSGFSQGGLMAVYTALRHKAPFAGIIGLSAVPVTFDNNTFGEKDILSKPPVTLIHGDADNVVPLAAYQLNMKNLTEAGFLVEGFIVPRLMHGIDNTALMHLRAALGAYLVK